MLSLTTTMQVNAISSGATGALLIAGAKDIALLFGVASSGIFLGIGIFLFLFATLVFIVSRKKPVNHGAVKFIITLDTLWVVGSAVALVFVASSITMIGSLLVAGVAVWVGLMAYLQNRGLHAVQPTI
jgi:hypothetical protein